MAGIYCVIPSDAPNGWSAVTPSDWSAVIPSDAPKARSRGIAILPKEGPLNLDVLFLDSAAARLRSNDKPRVSDQGGDDYRRRPTQRHRRPRRQRRIRD